MTIEIFGKDGLAGGDGLFLAHLAKAISRPGFLRTFYNEGRRFIIELIGVRPNPALIGFLENEGEGIVEFLMRPQPDKFAFAGVNIGLKIGFIFAAGAGIKPVTGDNQVIVRFEVRCAGDFGAKLQINPDLAGTLLQ